jgi:hypothetical protein
MSGIWTFTWGITKSGEELEIRYIRGGSWTGAVNGCGGFIALRNVGRSSDWTGLDHGRLSCGQTMQRFLNWKHGGW